MSPQPLQTKIVPWVHTLGAQYTLYLGCTPAYLATMAADLLLDRNSIRSMAWCYTWGKKP